MYRPLLILTKTEKMMKGHTTGLIYLLENLGFIVHPEKAVTIPIQETKFLGMVADS